VQRKVFRVEQMIGGRRASNVAQPPQTDKQPVSEPLQVTEARLPVQHELSALHDAIVRNRQALMALINDGNDRRMARAAGELAVAVESMETATQKVLASVETIDDCARTLASALTDDYHHGLAQDIQDHVVRVYEACNFQDLAGQRIGKVIATLMMVEEQLGNMIEQCNVGDAARSDGAAKTSPSESLLNGPRLDGDSGHASQQDIDTMFA